MDKIAGHEIFMPLYESYVMRPAFPDLAETYESLGLVPGPAGVEFTRGSAAGALRAAIMQRPAKLRR